VACVALMVALSGVSYAAGVLPATNGPDATIVAQSGGFSITEEATGAFSLDTGASIQGHAVLASIRPPGAGDGATVQVGKSGATEVSIKT